MFECNCKKSYKTERGFKNHIKKCDKYVEEIVISSSEEIEEIKEEIVEEIIDEVEELINKIVMKCPKIKKVKQEEEEEELIMFSKKDFIFKAVYDKKIAYLRSKLMNSKLSKKKILSYTRAINKLKKKTVL